MFVTREEIKVYHPEEGCAIKLSLNGQVIMYMVVDYYALPNYNYDVEEVDIEEAKAWINKTSNKAKQTLKFFK